MSASVDQDYQRQWLLGLVEGLQVSKYFGFLTVKFENGVLVYLKQEKSIIPPTSSLAENRTNL